jgi:hypothetical protein
MTDYSFEKKYGNKCMGPGGINCPCCGPAPKHRKQFFRYIKRKVRQLSKKEMLKAAYTHE